MNKLTYTLLFLFFAVVTQINTTALAGTTTSLRAVRGLKANNTSSSDSSDDEETASSSSSTKQCMKQKSKKKNEDAGEDN